MPSVQDFATQLDQCVETQDEINAFIEAFAKIRIRRIIKKLGPPAAQEWPTLPTANWTDVAKLTESGISHPAPEIYPERIYLHIDIALSAKQKIINRYIGMTGVSYKQRRPAFPTLGTQKARRIRANRDAVAVEVRRLNSWLDWVRQQGFEPERFIDYQKSVGVHGNTQNLSGQVGHIGAVCAFIDAIEEICPDAIVNMDGEHVDANTRSPEQILEWIDAKGKIPRAILLKSGRAVAFPSDPDVAIFEALGGKVFASAAEAYTTYDELRRQPDRRHKIHEFVVGEVKTATDPANLHERLALGSRETRDEVRTDRFLMMSVLTRDILRGGEGRKSGRSLESRDVERFSDVFNLHFAWGWDGGRVTHRDHWDTFKARVKLWCGL